MSHAARHALHTILTSITRYSFVWPYRGRTDNKRGKLFSIINLSATPSQLVVNMHTPWYFLTLHTFREYKVTSYDYRERHLLTAPSGVHVFAPTWKAFRRPLYGRSTKKPDFIVSLQGAKSALSWGNSLRQ